MKWIACLLLALAPGATARAQHLLVASYDPTREMYAQEYNPSFVKDYKARTGHDVTVEMSHGPSGSQARKIADGLEADVAALSVSADVDLLAKTGLIPADWPARLPDRSTPYTSTVVFMVRRGNPKGVKDWSDLIKPGVQIMCPNPKTGGGARWVYLAAWGQVVTGGGDEAAARDYLGKFYRNAVMDAAMRGSTSKFVKNQGDVLVGWENEILQVLATPGAKSRYEIVVPSSSITIEVPLTWVDKYADKHGTRDAAEAYVKYMFTPAGQAIVARHFNRPIDPDVMKRFADQYPAVKQFTLKEVFGDWPAVMQKHFADGGVFDQVLR